jgi:hypothetical protein
MISIETAVHFGRGSRTERQLREGTEPVPGRIPRISRLMALALHYDELLRTGVVKSLADLAELGHVSTTRISHIMNLLLLAPEIQERLLFLKPVLRGPDLVFLKELQPIARQFNWTKQRVAAVRTIPKESRRRLPRN